MTRVCELRPELVRAVVLLSPGGFGRYRATRSTHILFAPPYVARAGCAGGGGAAATAGGGGHAVALPLCAYRTAASRRCPKTFFVAVTVCVLPVCQKCASSSLLLVDKL